jgi:ACS family tartrate transporter-like MFS transporter
MAANPQGLFLVRRGAQPVVDSGSVVRSAERKASLRLLPVIAVAYGLACVDRINVSFAALRMNTDLHFSATVYGFGAGLFFVSYALCEVPANLLLLRFGARRWLASILFAWGLISAGMIFVRTPLQFDVLRLALGAAEAGFFPGVVYYLTLWFSERMRARAVSRFYIAAPLAATVMGSLASWLLGLNGRLGLAGWQWLFLVEGLPAALFSLVIWRALPDSPEKASWLTPTEKACLQGQLDVDSSHAHLGHGAGVLQSLLSPKVWMIGLFLFFVLTCVYAFQLLAPAMIQEATGWPVNRVGEFIAGLGLAGAVAMMFNSIHSDRTGERTMHCIVPCLVMAAGFLAAGVAHSGMVIVAGLGISSIAFFSLLATAVTVPAQFLAGRAAAAGIAAMNTITMFGGFLGPYWIGKMKDLTGNYQAGVLGLVFCSLAAVVVMLLLSRGLVRTRISVRRAEPLAGESVG